MKKYVCITALALMSLTSQAQQIAVNSGKETIQKINREGLTTIISMDEKKVAKAWETYLRNTGKYDHSKGVYTVELAKVPSISERPIRLISTINSSKSTTSIFCAFDLGSAYITSQHPKYREAEQFLYNFTKKIYQDEVAEQLKEAEKGLAAAQKKRDRSVQEGENLVKETERNKSEKESLERKLLENKAALDRLNRDIDTNKKDQSEAEADLTRNKRMVEEIRQKYSSIQ